MKINAADFILWALTHIKRESIPESAELPLPPAECGTEPWHYLFGTAKTHTTRAKLEERWNYFYKKHGWTREQFDYATKAMQPADYAADCGGLLDAYLTETIGRTDKSSNIYYGECTEKGRASKIQRPYEIGEAVFMAKRSGRMHHIGYVCGFLNGEPLVVEARGLKYGVVVTGFNGRGWTHRGLLTKYFEYGSAPEPRPEPEPTVFALTEDMMRGEAVKALQLMLIEAGYKDTNGDALKADGRLGKKTWAAFTSFLRTHGAPAAAPIELPEEIAVGATVGSAVYKGLLLKKKA